MPISGGSGIITIPGVTPMSLVLTAASSQYLSRTWTNSSSDPGGHIFTLAFWFKRLSDQAAFIEMYDSGPWNGGDSACAVRFQNNDHLEAFLYDDTTTLMDVVDSTVYSDTTTWHHVCVAIDSSQAVAGNRRNFWIDGISFTLGADTPPALNQNMHIADNGITSLIGSHQGSSPRYLNSQLAYFYLIDGQQLNVSSFVTGSGAGTTHPTIYTGTFGNNGFFLDFRNSNTNDQGGNSNNWTQNGGPTFSTDIPT